MKTISDVSLMLTLFQQDKTAYLSVKRLFRLERFIWKSLREINKVNNYKINLSFTLTDIEYTVMYHNKIFTLDKQGEVIYLKDKQIYEDREWQLDQVILGLVREFCTLQS